MGTKRQINLNGEEFFYIRWWWGECQAHKSISIAYKSAYTRWYRFRSTTDAATRFKFLFKEQYNDEKRYT